MPQFWLEIGSMLGGSIIRTANLIKQMNMSTSVVAMDPFCGDVNMITWEHHNFIAKTWRHIRNEYGRSSIYDRFLANIYDAKHHDIVVPLVATSTVGLKSIHRLHLEGRLSRLPEVIYVDSAHERGETLLELKTAWTVLTPGGVLFGDDFTAFWPGVVHDVEYFAIEQYKDLDVEILVMLKTQLPDGYIDANGIFVYKTHWLLVKKE